MGKEGSLWKCGERDDEREARFQVTHQSHIGSDELTALPLGQSDVQAVVNADPGRGGDLNCARYQWERGNEYGRIGEYCRTVDNSLTDLQSALPLSPGQGMSDFKWEDIR